MKKIAICDDNALQRQLLAEILEEYYRRNREKLELLEYDNGEALIFDAEDEEYDVDLIFLDICMPGRDGMDTAKTLRELHCSAENVFLTATADYALEGYDVQAAGYLVQPVDVKKLDHLLRHIYWREQRKRIEVKCGKQYRYPFINDIIYIESFKHQAIIHLAGGSSIKTIEKISTLKERIDDFRFIQCHQSYLVNMNYITDIRKNVILENEKEIPVSVRRKTEVTESYHRFFNQTIE